MDVLLTVSASVALNKESNVPGRPNLDKKKQVATVLGQLRIATYPPGAPALLHDAAEDVLKGPNRQLNAPRRRRLRPGLRRRDGQLRRPEAGGRAGQGGLP